MTRKWSGFLPQNLSIKEEWQLLEACCGGQNTGKALHSGEESQPITIRRGADGVPIPIKTRKHARRR